MPVNTALKILQAIALSGVIVFCCATVYTLNILTSKSSATLENLNRTTIIIGGAATNFEKASRTWQAASESQVQASTQFLKKTNAAMESFDAMVRRTDSNVNDILIPGIATAVERQDKSLLQVGVSLNDDLHEMNHATIMLEKTISDADETIADPGIKTSVANFTLASEHLAKGTEDGAATLADVRRGVHKEVEELLAPVNKAKQALLFSASVAGRFLGF